MLVSVSDLVWDSVAFSRDRNVARLLESLKTHGVMKMSIPRVDVKKITDDKYLVVTGMSLSNATTLSAATVSITAGRTGQVRGGVPAW